MSPQAPKDPNVLQKVQELAASIVLIEPGDLRTFQKAFQCLEELTREEWVRSDPSLHASLEEVQRSLERIVMNKGELEEEMKRIEKILQSLSSGPLSSQELPQEGKESEFLPSSSPPDSPTPSSPEEENPLASDPELIREFLDEARDNLDTIEAEIVELEKDPINQEVIHRIFRPFHTIKGVSGFLNLQEIHTLSHRVEDLLDQARDGKRILGAKEIDLVLEAVDLLKELLDAVEARLRGEAPKDLAMELEDLLGRLSASEREGGPPPLGQILTALGKVRPEDVEEALALQEKEAPRKPLGQILTEANKVKQEDVHEALHVQYSIAESRHGSGLPSTSPGTIRVDMAKLDNLVDMVGELVIAQSLIRQNPVVESARDHRLAKDFGQLARITSELQKTVMSLRMVPLSQIFQKMIRLVRDVSRKAGKEVRLTQSGEETEIDRNMVDAIYDPLVHMIRNAVDHGIEPPEQRERLGKPREGNVHLTAYHKGGNVVIEIRDDGRGLDRQRILQKARERGLLGPEDSLSDSEIDQLIFHPGFSTAARVTDVSGRGVGMDVVRKRIEELRGKVEIFSRSGEGCTFVIKLPLTLAIIDGMIVRVGEERYILPALNIRETFKPQKEHYQTVHNRGEMLHVRGRLLPLIRIDQLLQHRLQVRDPWEGLAVVVESEGEERCVLVDEVLGKQEVVIKSLGAALRRVPGISGGAILGDGRVGLILDINGLFRLFDEMEHPSLPRVAAVG